jgi:chromosome segregation ATPase
MSTLAFQPEEAAVGADDFAALEQRILRAVDLLKAERSARAAAEAKVAELHQSLEEQGSEILRVGSEIEALRSERELVRGRIERLLRQLDELSA